MNVKKIITNYLIIEIIGLIVAYVLVIKQSNAFANYIGMVTAISCAVGFGLAFYLIYMLFKKRVDIKKFTLYFLLSLSGVVLPYLFMLLIVAQLR
jgi:uncharacterized membrane protein SpoIIM required for sporulation